MLAIELIEKLLPYDDVPGCEDISINIVSGKYAKEEELVSFAATLRKAYSELEGMDLMYNAGMPELAALLEREAERTSRKASHKKQILGI